MASPAATPAQTTFSRRSAFILLGFVIVIWGINWPVVKVGLDTLPPFTFAALRVVMGTATMFAVLAVRRELALPKREDVPVILSVGFGQIAAFLVFINLGLQYVPAGRSAILAYTTPIWVVPGAVFLLHERFGMRTALGLAAGLVGIAVLFNPWGFDWSNREALIGNAYLLLAALAWAVSILHIKGHRWRSSPLVLAPWQLLISTIPLVALALALEPDAAVPLDTTTLLVLAFNGPIATAFAIWAWIGVNRSLPAITSALGSLGVPVVGLIGSAWLLDESIDGATVAGLAFIVGGLALVGTDTQAKKASGKA